MKPFIIDSENVWHSFRPDCKKCGEYVSLKEFLFQIKKGVVTFEKECSNCGVIMKIFIKEKK